MIDLVDKLPPERVVELVEFAEFWSLRRGDKSKNRDEILVAYGAFRESLPSTEEFQAGKQREIGIEDRHDVRG